MVCINDNDWQKEPAHMLQLVLLDARSAAWMADPVLVTQEVNA
jgi:hypothetical protein